MAAKRRVIPVFVPHQGCTNACVFCNQHRISGSHSPPSTESITETLENAANAGFEHELAFYGGSFTAIPAREQERLLGAALPFLRSGSISAIRVSTRPDAIGEAELNRLAEYGVTTVELGVQSMRDNVLTAAKRGHSAQQARDAARLVKDAGFELILQMMTGLPSDDDEGAVYTARELIKLKADGVRIYPTVLIKDTELFDMWERGEYAEHGVEDAVRVCSKLIPLFEDAGVPIIRLGLNPTDELSSGGAVGGAYHPALGELAYSRVMRNRAEAVLGGLTPDSCVTLAVHPRRLSQAIGQNRENIHWLIDKFQLKSLTVVETANPNITQST